MLEAHTHTHIYKVLKRLPFSYALTQQKNPQNRPLKAVRPLLYFVTTLGLSLEAPSQIETCSRLRHTKLVLVYVYVCACMCACVNIFVRLGITAAAWSCVLLEVNRTWFPQWGISACGQKHNNLSSIRVLIDRIRRNRHMLMLLEGRHHLWFLDVTYALEVAWTLSLEGYEGVAWISFHLISLVT